MKTMQDEETEKKPISVKKQLLIDLSVKARHFREEKINDAKDENEVFLWMNKSINDIIANWYRETSGAKVFKTLKQWNEEGKRIKKGEHAFVLWAKKETVYKKDEAGTKTDDADYEFFPMAFLFSDLQIENAKILEEATI